MLFVNLILTLLAKLERVINVNLLFEQSAASKLRLRQHLQA